MNLSSLFKHQPHEVTLDSGYQLLRPLEFSDRAEWQLRLYDPCWDTIVCKPVSYSSLMKGDTLDAILVLMIAELDTCGWVMRRFRRMPKTWRCELLRLVQA